MCSASNISISRYLQIIADLCRYLHPYMFCNFFVFFANVLLGGNYPCRLSLVVWRPRICLLSRFQCALSGVNWILFSFLLNFQNYIWICSRKTHVKKYMLKKTGKIHLGFVKPIPFCGINRVDRSSLLKSNILLCQELLTYYAPFDSNLETAPWVFKFLRPAHCHCTVSQQLL